ncbi:MAG: aminotransferase class V-fold PLP-dependent enzyme [Bacteroidetes bacterium]|jgi:selenocysteine lyase/cysteine desulfurase|nr:aminotransferase class V-fold PLP-dependent enzyme [Bacteroidota bacterium]
MTLDALRQQFPHTQETIYLNHAATGPLSRRAMDALQTHLQARHAGVIDNFEEVLPLLEDTRARLAALVGTSAERIALMPNTSYALNVLAEGYPWAPGDRVALPGCEFPANVYPFMNQHDRGVAVDFIPHTEGTFTLEDVEATLTPKTRLLTVSWVQFLSGFAADLDGLARLCRAHDVLLCVDAIQGLGALTLDVDALGIDFLACGGHKWLMSAQGTGFLYCTEALQAQLRPQAGWLHGPVDWEDFFAYDLGFHPDARRYHLGTMNTAGFMAMRGALGLYAEADPAACQERIRSHTRYLHSELTAQGWARYGCADPAHGSGIVTVRHPDAPGAASALKQEGIIASVRNRMLRLAPSYYNTKADLDAALDVLSRHATVPA